MTVNNFWPIIYSHQCSILLTSWFTNFIVNWFHHFSVILVYINSCINPFIYAAKYREFQQGVRRMLTHLNRKPPQIQPQQNIGNAQVISNPIHPSSDTAVTWGGMVDVFSFLRPPTAFITTTACTVIELQPYRLCRRPINCIIAILHLLSKSVERCLDLQPGMRSWERKDTDRDDTVVNLDVVYVAI